MKIFSNLPTSDYTPFPVIEHEPHPKKVLKFFRASDYIKAFSFMSFPLGLYLWELKRPTMHPRNRFGVFMIQIPVFLVSGFAFAGQGVLCK
jgi:hypothetical protein